MVPKKQFPRAFEAGTSKQSSKVHLVLFIIRGWTRVCRIRHEISALSGQVNSTNWAMVSTKIVRLGVTKYMIFPRTGPFVENESPTVCPKLVVFGKY